MGKKIEMTGRIDCIMHDHIHLTSKGDPHSYSKIWILLDGSKPEDPLWLEIERPMIPQCEWKGKGEIHSGDKVKVTMEIMNGD